MPLRTLIFVLVLTFGVGCDTEVTELANDNPWLQPVGVRKARPDLEQEAPGFTLVDLNGKSKSLSEYKGKVILLNFWATWCGPCRVEMPSMETVYRELKGEGFEILAISSDPQGVVVTRPYSKSNDLTFPILHDADYDVSGVYGVRTLPMSFLIDRHGTLRHKVFGARDWNSSEAKEIIRTLLKES
ncbi:MAG: TlpA disulfide reductase family protein [Nitrospirota bacterium]|nr:TlpA disulfide reductase family protein [Nitrospirota bacterium]